MVRRHANSLKYDGGLAALHHQQTNNKNHYRSSPDLFAPGVVGGGAVPAGSSSTISLQMQRALTLTASGRGGGGGGGAAVASAIPNAYTVNGGGPATVDGAVMATFSHSRKELSIGSIVATNRVAAVIDADMNSTPSSTLLANPAVTGTVAMTLPPTTSTATLPAILQPVSAAAGQEPPLYRTSTPPPLIIDGSGGSGAGGGGGGERSKVAIRPASQNGGMLSSLKARLSGIATTTLIPRHHSIPNTNTLSLSSAVVKTSPPPATLSSSPSPNNNTSKHTVHSQSRSSSLAALTGVYRDVSKHLTGGTTIVTRETSKGVSVSTSASTSPRLEHHRIPSIQGATRKGDKDKSPENEDRMWWGKTTVAAIAVGASPSTAESESEIDAGPGMVACYCFAVFDGHGGTGCAEWLRNNIFRHLKQTAVMRGENVKPRQQPTSSTVNRAAEINIVQSQLAFALEQGLKTATEEWELQIAQRDRDNSGACALVGMYCVGALCLANVGDCQALYRGALRSLKGQVGTIITRPHDGTNEEEVARYKAAGAHVSSSGRFLRNLLPSRTIGDIDVKRKSPSGCLTAKPELTFISVPLACDDDSAVVVNAKGGGASSSSTIPPFMVIASDGLWGTLEFDAVEEMVEKKVKKPIKKKVGNANMDSISSYYNNSSRKTKSGKTMGSAGVSGGDGNGGGGGGGKSPKTAAAQRGDGAASLLCDRCVKLKAFDDVTAIVIVFE